MQGSLATFEWSTSKLGYLPPQAFAYLLAAQVSLRNSDTREQRRVAGFLEANQAGFFLYFNGLFGRCRSLYPNKTA